MKKFYGLAFCFWLGMISVAWADVAPPPGYVEQCTLEKQQVQADTCTLCPSSYQDPEKCKKEWEAKGYEKRCQSRGASVWNEVWCKVGSTKPSTKTGTGCSILGQPATPSQNWWLLLSFLVLLFALKRSTKK